MNANSANIAQSEASGFDLFRLSKSKNVVDISRGTLGKYFKQGLNRYKMDGATFVSKAELRAFIISRSRL